MTLVLLVVNPSLVGIRVLYRSTHLVVSKATGQQREVVCILFELVRIYLLAYKVNILYEQRDLYLLSVGRSVSSKRKEEYEMMPKEVQRNI